MGTDLKQPSTPAETVAPPANRPGLTVLFAVTSFVGASLIFMVQPLVARMLLPHFGGSASVWSTSNLFFQALLLVGYLYVHFATRAFGRRSQPLLHGVLLLLPLLVLPIALPVIENAEESPVLALLTALTVMVGVPYVVIATTGPLLQRWYSWTGMARSEDPYFLFATSNLGSFVGLLAYPFLVEPFITLADQRTWWSGGFVVFLVLMAACGLQAFRGAGRATDEGLAATSASSSSVSAPSASAPAPGWSTIGLWLFLAFLPSTLMLSVTSHISTDVAAIPLMWVVPLAIYLATFIVAFAKVDRDPGRRPLQVALVAALFAAMIYLNPTSAMPIPGKIVVDLVLLAAGAYAAHAQLAATRPHTDHLTRFYLIVAFGGALGGLLNGVVAPLYFDRVWEYPLALVGVALLGLGVRRVPKPTRYHPAFVFAVQALGATILVTGVAVLLVPSRNTSNVAMTVVALAVALLVAALVSIRPAVLVVAVIGALAIQLLAQGAALHQERTFYGSYRVIEADDKHFFIHGSTVHGIQNMTQEIPEPLSYYGKAGPVGDLFSTLDRPRHVGAVGLGVGTLASYVSAGQKMTFFEIDPAVVGVAKNPDLFTFLSSTQADIEHVVGDGRLSLEDAEPHSFDLLVLDAFTSDAIPVHLLTREAFQIYADSLAEGGTLMVHISNRMFDLEPVLAQAAEDLGWQAALRVGAADDETDDYRSVWVALSPRSDTIDRLSQKPGWRPLNDERVLWTDNFSSVLSVVGTEVGAAPQP